MKDEKTLNIDLSEEEGVMNEIEEVEEGTLQIDDEEGTLDADDEEGTLDIVPEVPQEFIDKYHKNVQSKHGTNNTSDNK